MTCSLHWQADFTLHIAWKQILMGTRQVLISFIRFHALWKVKSACSSKLPQNNTQRLQTSYCSIHGTFILGANIVRCNFHHDIWCVHGQIKAVISCSYLFVYIADGTSYYQRWTKSSKQQFARCQQKGDDEIFLPLKESWREFWTDLPRLKKKQKNVSLCKTPASNNALTYNSELLGRHPGIGILEAISLVYNISTIYAFKKAISNWNVLCKTSLMLAASSLLTIF